MPTKPVVGVVRDKDTGKPLAGVRVRSHRIAGAIDLNGLVRTTTDKEGRYRLIGLPKGDGNAIIAETHGRLPRTDDLPYLAAIQSGRQHTGPGADCGRCCSETRHLGQGPRPRQGYGQVRSGWV